MVKLHSSIVILPWQLTFFFGVVFKLSSLTARRMVFAKVKRPVKVLWGAEWLNYASCIIAAMGFVLDHLESITLPKGLVSLLRDELDESTRTSIGPPVSPSLAPLGELYRLLGDWMSTECRGNWVRSCLRVAC